MSSALEVARIVDALPLGLIPAPGLPPFPAAPSGLKLLSPKDPRRDVDGGSVLDDCVARIRSRSLSLSLSQSLSRSRSTRAVAWRESLGEDGFRCVAASFGEMGRGRPRDVDLRRSSRRAADPDPEPPAPSASPNAATTASASSMLVGDATRPGRAGLAVRRRVVVASRRRRRRRRTRTPRLHRVAPLARAPSVPPSGSSRSMVASPNPAAPLVRRCPTCPTRRPVSTAPARNTAGGRGFRSSWRGATTRTRRLFARVRPGPAAASARDTCFSLSAPSVNALVPARTPSPATGTNWCSLGFPWV